MKRMVVSSVLFVVVITFVLGANQVKFEGVTLAESVRQQPTAHSLATVVQMSYHAQPGKEEEVLDVRLQACAVLEKMGITRGRVMRRINRAMIVLCCLSP